MPLNQEHTRVVAAFAHIFGPDAGLRFSDVRLVQKDEAETRLANAAADGEWQRAFEQPLVELEFLAVLLARQFELAQQSLFIDTDTH